MARGPERPSSIDRLPEEIREAIGKLRVQGRSIDEILAHLKAMDVEVSRSALGRHVKNLAALRERMRSSRDMATALVAQFGDQPDNKLGRLNLELMHGIILQTLTASAPGEDGEEQPVTFNPQEAKFLADALQKLSAAEKTDTDRQIILRRELAKEAAKAAGGAARSAGLTADVVKAIETAVLGVAA